MTTTDFIREMRALCEKATPGPWEAILWPNGEWEMRAKDGPIGTAFGNICSTATLPKPGLEEESFANATLIHAARTALPEALDRLEKLEAENETLREELRQKQIDEDLRKGVDRYDLD